MGSFWGTWKVYMVVATLSLINALLLSLQDPWLAVLCAMVACVYTAIGAAKGTALYA